MRWLREGMRTPKFYQAVANGRRTKNFIPDIHLEEEIVTEQGRKVEVFTEAF
jgi:hypothetical protein